MDFFRLLLGCADQSSRLTIERAKPRSKPLTLQEVQPQTTTEGKSIDAPICQQTVDST
jgi:hypothetical protein